MAKLILGSSPDEIDRAEAKRMREIEAEVQARQQEQANRIKKLVQTEKRNKVIILSVISVSLFILISCCVYQAFFKPILSQDDVSNMITTQTAEFNKNGLHGYIYDNFTTWFGELASEDREDIEHFEPDLSTLVINDIAQTKYQRFISVDFAVDVMVKHVDTKGENDTIVPGIEETSRYYFSIPIEMSPVKNSDGTKIKYYAYQPASQMRLTFYDSTGITEVDKASPYLVFPEETDVDEDTLESAKLKLNRLLSDLYDGKDVGADLGSLYEFKDSGAKFVEIVEFEYHTDVGKNQLGSNARCVYTVETKDGIKIRTEFYCVITKNGSTYSIGSVL